MQISVMMAAPPRKPVFCMPLPVTCVVRRSIVLQMHRGFTLPAGPAMCFVGSNIDPSSCSPSLLFLRFLGSGLVTLPVGNAIHHAKTPVMDAFKQQNYRLIQAHGHAVGLLKDLMGNSEVGHMNIGAGRVCYQVLIFGGGC